MERKQKNDQTLITQITGNGLSRNIPITYREQIVKIIESPLVEACQILYDKNIQTIDSSANKNNVRHSWYAGIVINYDTLSRENQEIAVQEFWSPQKHKDGYFCVTLRVPLTSNSTSWQVRRKTILLAKKLKTQPLSRTKILSLKEAKECVSKQTGEDRPNLSPEDIAEYLWRYYDSETQCYYYSKEHCDKIKKQNNT